MYQQLETLHSQACLELIDSGVSSLFQGKDLYCTQLTKGSYFYQSNSPNQKAKKYGTSQDD